MANNFDERIIISHVLASEQAENGQISLQIGDVLAGDVDRSNAEYYSVAGILARPADPISDTEPSAETISLQYGDRTLVIGSRDVATTGIAGNLKAGETCVYAGSGQARVSLKANGRVSLFTTDDNTEDGRSVYLTVSPDKGFEVSSPWGRLTLGPTGFHVLTSGGARIDLGSIGGLPGPLASLSTYATIDGGIVSVKGGAVSLGTDGGLGNEIAVTALTTLLTAINTALVAISVTPAAVGSPVLTPAQAASVTTALSAYAATAGAIGKVV